MYKIIKVNPKNNTLNTSDFSLFFITKMKKLGNI